VQPTGRLALQVEEAVLDVFAVVFVFGVIAAVLTGKIDLVLFGVGLVEIGRGHFEDLGDGDEEVEEVDDFDAGILFIELLVFGPPFPRDAVGEFGDFLGEGAAVVEDPLLALVVGHVGGVDADALVKLVLEAEDFFEFVRCIHKAVDIIQRMR